MTSKRHLLLLFLPLSQYLNVHLLLFVSELLHGTLGEFRDLRQVCRDSCLLIVLAKLALLFIGFSKQVDRVDLHTPLLRFAIFLSLHASLCNRSLLLGRQLLLENFFLKTDSTIEDRLSTVGFGIICSILVDNKIPDEISH